MAQENKLVINVTTIRNPKDEALLRDAVGTLPGVESVVVNGALRSISIIGVDIPREDVIERIEGVGFTVIS